MLTDRIKAINWQKTDNWLLIIGAGLTINHFILVWRVDDSQLLANSLLLWVATCLLIWQKRHTLDFNSQPIATSIGLFLVSFILLRSSAISEANFFLRVYPILALWAWSLLASGIGGIRQYLKELAILSCFILDSTFLSNALNISVLTAKFSGYLLWYLGFPVSLQGVNIILPTGSVEVNSGCSGYTIMLQLASLSIIFISLFPTSYSQKIILPIAAIAMGFIINIFRVGLMAILVANNQKEAFNYWHQGDGSLIFSAIAAVLFSLLYNFLNRDREIVESEE